VNLADLSTVVWKKLRAVSKIETKNLAHLLVTVEHDGQLLDLDSSTIRCEGNVGCVGCLLKSEIARPIYVNVKNTEGSIENGNKSSGTPFGYHGTGRQTSKRSCINDTVCGQFSDVGNGYLNCESGRPVYADLKNTDRSSKNGNKSSGTPLGYHGTGTQTAQRSFVNDMECRQFPDVGMGI